MNAKCSLLKLDVLYLRNVCEYLTFNEFQRLDEAVENADPLWDLFLGSLVGCRCVESAFLDLPDLDWLMSKKNLRLGRAIVKTARRSGSYPFTPAPAFFGSIKELRLLDEAYSFLMDFSSDCNMTLTALEIDGAPLTAIGIEVCLQNLLLNHCKSLKELSLHKMGGSISDDLFIEFSQVLQEESLETLSLSFCEKSTDFRHGLQSVTFMCLASKLTALRFLELTNFYLVTDEALFIISLHCSTLEVVGLSFCREVTGGGIRVLANSSKNLRHLCVGQCNRLDDSVFFGDGIHNPDGSIIPGSSSTSGWDATSTATASSADRSGRDHPRTLAALRAAEGNPVWGNLSELVLQDCSLVTNDALLLLPSLTPNLTKFCLANCTFKDWALEAFFISLDQEQAERWSGTSGGKSEVGHGSLRHVELYGCEIKEQTLEALYRHHSKYLERVGFTSKIDNETIKKLESAGVKMDWIPWWTDESW